MDERDRVEIEGPREAGRVGAIFDADEARRADAEIREVERVPARLFRIVRIRARFFAPGDHRIVLRPRGLGERFERRVNVGPGGAIEVRSDFNDEPSIVIRKLGGGTK